MAGDVITLARLKELAKYYFGGLYHQLNEKDIFLWAQAIAFKVLVTIVPVIILATGVLGQVLRRDKPFETVAGFLRDFLPPYQTDKILEALGQLQSASDALTIIGAAGLVFSAMTLMTTLRVVIANVFQEDWHKSHSILGGYAFDLRMAGQAGLLFILTMALSIAVQALNTAGTEMIQEGGLDYVWVRMGWRRVFSLLGLLLPFLVSTAMFFQLFYFIPKPHPPKRSALTGACVAALLWEIAKAAFTVYATYVGRFDRFSSGDGSDVKAVLGDTFGLIIAFVFWVYYSGLVLSLGALIALLHEKRLRARKLEQEQASHAFIHAPEPAKARSKTVPAAGADETTRALDEPYEPDPSPEQLPAHRDS